MKNWFRETFIVKNVLHYNNKFWSKKWKRAFKNVLNNLFLKEKHNPNLLLFFIIFFPNFPNERLLTIRWDLCVCKCCETEIIHNRSKVFHWKQLKIVRCIRKRDKYENSFRTKLTKTDETIIIWERVTAFILITIKKS